MVASSSSQRSTIGALTRAKNAAAALGFALAASACGACGGASSGASPPPSTPDGADRASPPQAEKTEKTEENVAEIVARAEAALDAKDYDRAESLAKEAIDADASGSPDAYVVLGEVALARRAPGRALALFEKAMAIDPSDAWATTSAAEALTQLARKEDARKLLRRFVDAHADAADADVYDALAWAEHEANDVKRAEAAFQSALRVSSDGDAEAHYGLAVLAADRGDAKTTERELRAALALEPERWEKLKTDDAFQDVRGAPGMRALFAKKPPPAAPRDKPKPRGGRAPRASATPETPASGAKSADVEPTPGPAVSVDGEQLGRVTYAGARVDLSLSKALAFFPQAEILHVAPATDADQDLLRTYAGGGIILRPSDTWTFEAGATYSPIVQHLESIGGRVSASKELGAEGRENADVEIELALEVTRFRWDDGLGPAGPALVQSHAEAIVLVRATSRLELTPRAMYFLYDQALDHAVGDRLGSALVFANVGAFAPPRALVGLRVGYVTTAWLTPLLAADQIFYAYGSGDATELLAGAKLTLHKGFAITAAGGALLNRASGPIVPAEDADKTLPVAILQLDVEL